MRRRHFILALAGSALPMAVARAQSERPPGSIPFGEIPEFKAIANGRRVQVGRVRLQIPVLADNGNSVPIRITIDSSMTEAEHVKAVYLLSERNPERLMAVFNMSPANGRAQITSRVRLAGSQRVTAVAEMSDGSLWSGGGDIVVTMSACSDES